MDFSFIRTLRLKRGKSAEDLANAANLTRATITKLENGSGNPTIATIESLARFFGLLPSELIQMAEVGRCEKATTRTMTRGGVEGRHICYPDFEIFHYHAKAGSTIQSDPQFHENTAEICCVLAGRIYITVSEEGYELKSGDALRFKALLEHNISVSEDSELIMIHHNF